MHRRSHNLYAQESSRLLAEDNTNIDEVLRHLSKVEEYSDRSTEIIKRMKAFAMKGKMVREECDANEIVEGIKDMIEIAAKPAAVRVVYELHDKPLPLFVDVIQIQQCLLNLARNSIEAMGENPDSVLTLGSKQFKTGKTEFLISDTGPGFVPNFEIGISTKNGGMGLGLKVASEIIRKHGGQLTLKGREARISLP